MAIGLKKMLQLKLILALLACTVLWGVTSKVVSAAADYDYNVKTDFGAVGNGVADDTSAIQAAINAAQDDGGGIVFFPKGKYRTTSQLTVTGSNVVLQGVGKSSVIALDKQTGAVIKIGHASNLDLTTFNKVVNLTVDRFVAPDANYTANPSYGIFVESARFTDIEGVNVYNAAYGIAVGVKGGSGILNQFTSIANTRIMTSGSISGTSVFPGANVVFWAGADYKVSHTFLEPTHIGISMEDNSNGINIDAVSIINGGSFDYGIVAAGTGFARYITNSILENALHQQIYITGSSSRFTLSNSWLGAGDYNGDRKGILIESGAQKVTIADNRIGDQRSSAIVSYGNDINIRGNLFEGNVNSGSASDSVEIRGGTGITITGNQITPNSGRYGIGLYDDGARKLNNYVVSDNNLTGGLGTSLVDNGTGPNKLVANNLQDATVSFERKSVLDHADSASSWTSDNGAVSVNASELKEGGGSLESTGSGTVQFRKVFSTPVNANVSLGDGYLQLWYYVSDVTQLSSLGQIEISSSGDSDTNEYNWTFDQLLAQGLTTGWNRLNLKLSEANVTNGTPDLSHINFFRIFNVGSGSLTARIDDIVFSKGVQA